MLLFDVILQGEEATEENACDFARGFVWSECEQTEQPRPTYSQYFNTVNGIDIYYDYGADYYFFAEGE